MSDVIWSNTVDGGKFACSVTSIGQRTGQLVVKVVDSGVVLLDEPVGLSYGAVFGPDISDVIDWEDRSIAAIDDWISKNE